MEDLDNPRFFDLNNDSFNIRIDKSEVIKLAISLFKRLFPSETQVVDAPR